MFLLAREASAKDDLLVSLRESFATSDATRLEVFCQEWEKHSRTFLEKRVESQLEITRAVEEVYLTFASSPLNDKHRPQYFVVQISMNVVVSEELGSGRGTGGRDVHAGLNHSDEKFPDSFRLNNFGPKQLLKHSRVLLLDKMHEEVLLKFLANSDDIPAIGRIGLLSRTEEHTKRKDFLSTKLPALPGHWGAGWWLESFPVIESIAVTHAMDGAAFSYRHGYGGGVRACKKVNGRWIMDNSDLTQWVE